MVHNKDNEIFLKVDCVEPVYENGYSISSDTRLNGIKVWIGDHGCFFPCSQYILCDLNVACEAAREAGRRQVVALWNELGKMTIADNKKLFGYCAASDILARFSYDEIVKKLDAWKKEKEKIWVRDEVYHQSMQVRFVVTKIFVPSGDEDVVVNGIKKDGTAIRGVLLHNVKKTGLHVDDLDSYLEV